MPIPPSMAATVKSLVSSRLWCGNTSRLFWLIIYEQPTAMRLLASPEGVAERSESFKIMIAGGNHTEIKKLAWQIIGTSEPIIYHD